MDGMAPYRFIDDHSITWIANGNRSICLLHIASCKCLRQCSQSRPRFGDHEDTGCALIQTMNNTRAKEHRLAICAFNVHTLSLFGGNCSILLNKLSRAKRALLGQIMGKSIDDCAIPITSCRMDHHTGGLVDYNHMFVLKQYVEGQILSNNFLRAVIGNMLYSQNISRRHLGRLALHGGKCIAIARARYRYLAILDERSTMGAR